ncbi:MAG: hypothetical protein KZQ70_00600 [gamma proteobacterium symbiont of Lucinoma myriamae]|nr:hypothetical protein [gamma proteobacterium symbiont of Lucinoma myriamae]MCU7819914.1 hypothetical protein [gamma proteobacterium symbiont of Lucinoma myriamae]MCU7831263.1 hypothetical protein [gamma proteobacterium symbiont of Lucinoma myriamae]
MFITKRLCCFLLFIFIVAMSIVPAASAQEKAFWLNADDGIQMFPQTATKSITHHKSGVEPESAFNHYADQSPPIVPPRKDQLTFYPCSQCHENWQTNETPRILAPVHEVSLKHGEGRLWCLSCHDPKDRDKLRTVRNDNVDFNESWKVCGQCHSNRQKDWYYGAHGKRAYYWKGEKIRYNCTQCHNPHNPPFMQRKPQPIPPVRAGLNRMKPKDKHESLKVWERHMTKAEKEIKYD